MPDASNFNTTGGSASHEGIDAARAKFENRNRMWFATPNPDSSDDTLGLITALEESFTRSKRDLLSFETTFQQHKTIGNASGHLVGIAMSADFARRERGINASFFKTSVIDQSSPLGRRVDKINKFSDYSLAERIAKAAEIKAEFDDPTSGMTGLTGATRDYGQGKLREYEKHIQKGNYDKAEALLEKPFKTRQKLWASITGNRHHVEAIEEAFEAAKAKSAYFRETGPIREDLSASITMEQKSVARTIAKMANSGRKNGPGGDLATVLGTLSPAQIAADANLTQLSEIINGSASLNKKDLGKYIIDNNLAFDHENLKAAIKTADAHVQKARFQAEANRDMQQARIDMLRKYVGTEQSPGKLAVLASRETQFKMGETSRNMVDVLDHLDDGDLNDEQTDKLMRHMKYLHGDGLITDENYRVIADNVAIMAQPNFDPKAVDTKALDKIIDDQRRAHFWMNRRENAHTAGQWARAAADKTGITYVATKTADAAKASVDGVKGAVIHTASSAASGVTSGLAAATTAFHKAANRLVTHPVKSAYHNVKGAASQFGANAASSHAVREPEAVWESMEPASFKTPKGQPGGSTGQPAIITVPAIFTKYSDTNNGANTGNGTYGPQQPDL